ncbi:MAG: Maf family nucleotide pyrophosphatase [Bacteroidales bacterium]
MLDGRLKTYEILLASGSPRRKELMEQLGLPFRVVRTRHGEETYPSGLSGDEIAFHLARHKSESFRETLGPRQILLTADTVVWHRGRELGKPGSAEEALAMLRTLSGDTHQVYTGVFLRWADGEKGFVSRTDVRFSRLSEDEIRHYVSTCHPMDKAGAYGIQEWIGHVAVEDIRGSYFNVMGLPVQRVYHELKQILCQPNCE